MDGIKCINSIYTKVKPTNLRQMVIEYTAHNGCHGTKIVEELDGAGNKLIKDIKRDISMIPNKVVQVIDGRKETYVPAFSEHQQGVFMYTDDNVKTYFPNIVFSDLCKY